MREENTTLRNPTEENTREIGKVETIKREKEKQHKHRLELNTTKVAPIRELAECIFFLRMFMRGRMGYDQKYDRHFWGGQPLKLVERFGHWPHRGMDRKNITSLYKLDISTCSAMIKDYE